MRRVPALMILGTGSNVGKSLLVAGLCRLFADRGLAVRPFKPQNMSNNAAATHGGEIGRAQALQARAARTEADVDMNPVLLKPESESGSQIVLQGKVAGRLSSRDYARRSAFLPQVLASFERLSSPADLVLVEGAGSPAETNLRAGDIANLGFARAADVPAVLVGDIDRGGVIASLVGTHAVLDPADRAMIRSFAVNRFRGDASLFAPGIETVEAATGWPCLGIVPWFPDAALLPAEDGLDLARAPRRSAGGSFRIGVPLLPGIANFDDLDPLKLEPSVDLVMVQRGQPLPGDLDLVILPGSKTTMRDLGALRQQGWDVDLVAHRRRGGGVLGLCGGFQMLGRTVRDPLGLEGPPGEVAGLGMLDIETELLANKTVREVVVTDGGGAEGRGYEIHLGRSDGPDCERAPFSIAGRPEGASSLDGRVVGTYVHGLLGCDAMRRNVLARFGLGGAGIISYDAMVETTLDRLASHLDAHLDCDALLELANSRRIEKCP